MKLSISHFPQNEINCSEKLPNILCFNKEYLHGGLLSSTSLNQASVSYSPYCKTDGNQCHHENILALEK